MFFTLHARQRRVQHRLALLRVLVLVALEVRNGFFVLSDQGAVLALQLIVAGL